MNSVQVIGLPESQSALDPYTTALARHLQAPSESTLRRAYEIGRQGMCEIGLLELAATHHAALARLLAEIPPSEQESALRLAGEFLSESLSSYEMAHRGVQDAIDALHSMNETLEGEIRRIAQTVHDDAGQLLVAARLGLSLVSRDCPPRLRVRLKDAIAVLDQVDAQLRQIARELRPSVLDDLGLVRAVRFLADSISSRTGIRVQVESSCETRHATGVETAVYRVIQEALTNVARHAHARNVRIELRHEGGRLQCVIRDDGAGFDVTTVLSHANGSKGLGLLGIRERLSAVGGTVDVQSEPGRGTSLVVMIPMEECHADTSLAS